ncbi:AAA domain-containing protein [Flavobacteriaceae bacterium]|nr:AAA domain-containing protein [Flavobacteriaceae bacterium]
MAEFHSTQEDSFLITDLKEKLIDINARSIYVDALPKKNNAKIDLIPLIEGQFNLSPKSFIQLLWERTPFTLRFPFQNKFIDLNKKQKILRNLLRKNVDYKHEYHIDPIGLGFPLVVIPDHKKQRLRYMPVFIWDIKITGHLKRAKSILLSRDKQASIAINPSLIQTIKAEYQPNFKPGKNDMDLLSTEALKQTFYHLADALGCVAPQRFFSEYNFVEPLPIISPKYQSEISPFLINNGVLGIFANSKEALINDYQFLEEKTTPCHFGFSNNKNTSFFSGVALDHSQQKVMRNMNLKNRLLIHGPPGTGKSTTLTAVIAYALSKGQQCLLVCEKRTAMDVIHENLKALGFDSHSIAITDVKKDRRMVVNKAREIIEQQNDKGALFETVSAKPLVTNANKKNIAEKIEQVNGIVALIENTKRKLNHPILNNATYSDIILKLFDKDNLAPSLPTSVNGNNFEISPQEWEGILDLFQFLNAYETQFGNPYQSYYPILDALVLSQWEAARFEATVAEIRADLLPKLKQTQELLSAATATLNPFRLKNLNTNSPPDEAALAIPLVRLKQLKVSLSQTGLWNKSFFNSLHALPVLEQVPAVELRIEELWRDREKFSNHKHFDQARQKLPYLHQNLAEAFFSYTQFQNTFSQWYLRRLLRDFYVDNFDFNGFEKGYYDIASEVRAINTFKIAETLTVLNSQRLRSMATYNRNSPKLTLEQFFAKRSTEKRKKKSLTKIVKDKSRLFFDFFPVVMTSPNVCAQLFPMERGLFDLVIFDESSQLRLEDTYSALLRGKQQIVSGDIHQLPPSDYFVQRKSSNSEKSTEKKSFSNVDSLLSYCMQIDFEDHYLDVHYRSRHPDLIAFSNHAFYRSRLIPLPPKAAYVPIAFREVAGQFINRINKKEATAIVNYLAEEVDPDTSLGIATFSLSQRHEIFNQIEKRTQKDAVFYEKIKRLTKAGFFVKNLENIQGEERDIIIISSTYGPGKTDVFKAFLGPINSRYRGHKLLNVLITRAKTKILVFNSIPDSVINEFSYLIDERGNRTKAIFYAFLKYAKAISQGQRKLANQVLDKISIQGDSSAPKAPFLEADLKRFSDYLKQVLEDQSGLKLNLKNNFQLGGFVYEISITDEQSKTLVIDLNGKIKLNSYEDYIFDVKRCEIAVDQGFGYYRLWLSNFYNNPGYEIKKLLTILLDKS